MSEKIEPALTPEEWREGRFSLLFADHIIVHDDGDGIEVVAYPDGEAAARRSGPVYKYKIESWAGKDAHAIAAMLLHGQPFGFTREDVRLLYGMASGWEREDPEALTSLAARIEALLPPRESLTPKPDIL